MAGLVQAPPPVPNQNLIHFFMLSLWNRDSPIRADYFRFLRSICKFGDDGVSLNQELIYKLYKKMSAERPGFRLNEYISEKGELVLQQY